VCILLNCIIDILDSCGFSQSSDVLWYYGQCYYPAKPARGLGICATIFLIIAQIIFAVVGGCCGFCHSRAIPSEKNRIIGVVCAVASW
jgi:hypothetical protein